MTLQLEHSNPDGGQDLPGPPRGYDTALLTAIAVVGLTLIVLAAYLLLGRDSGDGGFDLVESSTTVEQPAAPSVSPSSDTTAPSSATTSDPTGTTGASTTTSPSTATTTVPSSSVTTTTDSSGSTIDSTIPSSSNWVIWPNRNRSSGFDTPIEAARSFAVDLAGFDEPIIGEFQAGDGRSGEVEVRPAADGPVTTVLVRQVDDDESWWVIGAITDDIVIDRPTAEERLGGLLRVSGRARAFEGMVDVALVMLESGDQVVAGSVTGRGDGELGEFTEDFDLPSGVEGRAVLLLTAPSAEDGSAWAVTALPIRIG